MKKATVIGGGFAGLTTAYYLSRSGFSVEVHERAHSWGGLLKTHHTPFGMIETAANGILKTQALVELCQEVGISLMGAGKKSKRRFIYRNAAKRWPLNGMETFQLLPSLFLLLVCKKHKKPKPGQRLSHWVEETLNAKALNYLVAPALQGVYADSPEYMSAHLIMDRFFKTPKKKTRKKLCTVAPEKGMGQLVDQLVSWLKKNQVALYPGSHYTLPTTLSHPHIVCTGVKATTQIIKQQCSTLSQKLSNVDRLSLVSTTVFFKPSPDDLEGFGCLFPECENFFHLGVLYNDCIFENRSQEYRSETWIGGGATNPTAIGCSDKEILDGILRDRARVQKGSEIQFSQITRWPEVLPRYGLELKEALDISFMPQNLYLNGNYMGGIGLSRILERAHQLPNYIMRGI